MQTSLFNQRQPGQNQQYLSAACTGQASKWCGLQRYGWVTLETGRTEHCIRHTRLSCVRSTEHERQQCKLSNSARSLHTYGWGTVQQQSTQPRAAAAAGTAAQPAVTVRPSQSLDELQRACELAAEAYYEVCRPGHAHLTLYRLCKNVVYLACKLCHAVRLHGDSCLACSLPARTRRAVVSIDSVDGPSCMRVCLVRAHTAS